MFNRKKVSKLVYFCVEWLQNFNSISRSINLLTTGRVDVRVNEVVRALVPPWVINDSINVDCLFEQLLPMPPLC